MEKVIGSIQGKEVIIETGKIARQANGSVTLTCENTVLLATATMSKKPREGIDFLPLIVEFVEKYYAAGKFAGGYIKREARPSKNATLLSRLIDRPLRPCFPDGMYHEVQIVITLLSYDETHPIESLAILAASSALAVSDIPFNTYVGAALVGEIDGQLVVNPSRDQLAESSLDMIVSGTNDAVLMIESSAKEMDETRIVEAIELGHNALKEGVQLQEQLVAKVSKSKRTIEHPEKDAALQASIRDFVGTKIIDRLGSLNKKDVEDFLSTLEQDVKEKFTNEDETNAKDVSELFNEIKKSEIRQSIIQKKVRPDGRKTDEIRPLSMELDVLPSGHGSALFTRGETQSLGVITLGTDGDEQKSDEFGEQVAERFYFHYNFPPYSVGECGFMGRISRRELGHGQLAQRALGPVMPTEDDFPYVVRLVSEILESNGSSSMASVCSGSLALMSSGVPTTGQVSGIAMGLLMDDAGEYTILSDIQGLEDHYGDMDFKVAGTSKGITALQLDIKIEGLSKEILTNALTQAKQGRLNILEQMNQVIDTPAAELTDRAPKLETITINPDKVGLLIGPGGKKIKEIEKTTEAVVYVVDGDNGVVSISGKNNAIVSEAKSVILTLVKDIERGEVYDSRVVKVVNFGAFVELSPGKEALLHISNIARERVEKVEDYLTVGDTVKVKVMEVDRQGKVNVSRIFDE